MPSRPVRLLVGLSAAGLALAPAASASAATVAAKAKPLVSLAQAPQALPDGADMPGQPPSEITSSTPGFLPLQPCLDPTSKPLTMKQSHAVSRVYTGLDVTNDPTKLPTTFVVTAYVFHTTAAARTGLAAVLHAEKHCPRTAGDDTASITRTLSKSYVVRGWTGWRSIDHLAVTADPANGVPAIAMRLNVELVARGNVLLQVQELGGDGAGSGAEQEKSRKQATTAVLNGFAKL